MSSASAEAAAEPEPLQPRRQAGTPHGGALQREGAAVRAAQSQERWASTAVAAAAVLEEGAELSTGSVTCSLTSTALPRTAQTLPSRRAAREAAAATREPEGRSQQSASGCGAAAARLGASVETPSSGEPSRATARHT